MVESEESGSSEESGESEDSGDWEESGESGESGDYEDSEESGDSNISKRDEIPKEQGRYIRAHREAKLKVFAFSRYNWWTVGKLSILYYSYTNYRLMHVEVPQICKTQLNSMRQFYKAVMMLKIVNGLAPPYLTRMFIFNYTQNNYGL